MISQFFSVFDIASALFVLLLIVVHAFWLRHRHAEMPHYRFFLPGIYFKIIISLSFSFFYILYYEGGGDTFAYWDGAMKLNNLFWESPTDYFSEIFNSGSFQLTTHFNNSTGLPPSWIYRESESWAVCKIISIFLIIGLNGYLAVTLLFSYLSSLVTWKFYELVLSYNLHRDYPLAIAVLFIPSVSFWCSGVSKDTILYISELLFICALFRLNNRRKIVFQLVNLFFFGYILYAVRSIMLAAVLVPIIFSFSSRLLKHIKSYGLRITMSGFIISGEILLLLAIFSNQSILQSETTNSLIQEATVIQQDFTNNLTYGTDRYYLGIDDFTLRGMALAMPTSILAGLYRPFLWEALSPALILNGIESFLLLFFTLRFFLKKNLYDRILLIRKHELLIYLLVAMLFIAFFSGFTSVLFGVLVRIRAFALPFLGILLFVNAQQNKEP